MPAVGGPGAAPRRGRVRGATWTAENRLRFAAESDGGTVTSKPFFGPVRRADGVFQLYVELPYHHYLEIDSLTFHGTVGTPSARAWADVV